MKKLVGAVIGLLLLTQCGNEPFTTLSGAEYVPIKAMTMPDSATLGTTIEIALSAQAPDGCFLELQFDITATDATHTTYKSWGKFTDDGNCPAFKPAKDTIVQFKAPSVGLYYFTANQMPNVILKDTLVVY